MTDWLKADFWYRCKEHQVPYPRGAQCPKCKMEKLKKDLNINHKK
jgi:hypothetical protein